MIEHFELKLNIIRFQCNKSEYLFNNTFIYKDYFSLYQQHDSFQFTINRECDLYI